LRSNTGICRTDRQTVGQTRGHKRTSTASRGIKWVVDHAKRGIWRIFVSGFACRGRETVCVCVCIMAAWRHCMARRRGGTLCCVRWFRTASITCYRCASPHHCDIVTAAAAAAAAENSGQRRHAAHTVIVDHAQQAVASRHQVRPVSYLLAYFLYRFDLLCNIILNRIKSNARLT